MMLVPRQEGVSRLGQELPDPLVAALQGAEMLGVGRVVNAVAIVPTVEVAQFLGRRSGLETLNHLLVLAPELAEPPQPPAERDVAHRDVQLLRFLDQRVHLVCCRGFDGNQPSLFEALVEVGKNVHRLDVETTVMDQGRHNHVGLDRGVLRRQVILLDQRDVAADPRALFCVQGLRPLRLPRDLEPPAQALFSKAEAHPLGARRTFKVKEMET